MKKISNIVLCIVVILSSFLMHDTNAAEISTDQGKRFIEYWQTGYPKLLLTSSNYEYLQFINDFNGNALSLYLLNMADLFADTGVKPDRNKYIDVLMNIVFTYDGENSGDIAEQKKTDNLKTYEDYSEDVTDIGIQAVDKLIKLGGAAGELKDQISMAVDGLKVLKDNTENYCESLSRIETIISNYVKYDDFFEIIESNSKGELKEAASSIKRAMETSMNKYLYSYQDISDENFNNWTEYIFNDVFIDTCKKLPEYENDETFKWYIDGADNFMEKFSELSGSWDLGASIGTLVGNLTVGGENLANRLLEIMAIKDIGEVLTGALEDIYVDDFTKAIGTEKEIEVVERYVMVSKILIGTRIRGEYCWYSIIAHDAGLLSLFNKENGKRAEEVYKSSVNVLKEIQEELNEIIEQEKIVVINQAFWEDFIKSSKYMDYITDGELWHSLEYIVYDINQDKSYELLIEATDDEPFYNTWLFIVDKNQNIELIYECYGYGQFRYSPTYNAILISPETKPMLDASYSPFYELKNNKFVLKFGVGNDFDQNYIFENNKKKSITIEEKEQYFADVIYFQWKQI